MSSKPPPTNADIASRARTVFVVSVVLTLALYVIPYGRYLAYPLVLISTLVHELGHGVAALLTGASFEKFVMFKDGSGVASWRGDPSAFGRAFISAGGLVGPAIGAAVSFVAARKDRGARIMLGVLGLGLVLAEIFVVRNGFGFVFVGALAALCLGVGLLASAQVAQLVLVFLAVQLALSVYSRGDYLFTQYADTAQGQMPSDVQQMSNALALPYWFWGGLCAAVSVLALAVGGYFLLRSNGTPRKSKIPRP